MKSFGYRVPWLPALAYTGGASVANAFLGGPCINLAAISAALAAGPDAGPDPARRCRAGVACGVTYLLLVPASALVVAVAQVAPAGMFAAIAGLALVATWANATANALGDGAHRMPAALTMVIAASGFSVFGVGAAFWALLGGLLMYALQHRPARTPG
ncbi:hypothetical protein GCM10028815_09080 [Mariniluteicoccus flavus]